MVWLVSGAHDEFYADLRRPGRQDEDRALNSDQGLSTVPPLRRYQIRSRTAACRASPPFSWTAGSVGRLSPSPGSRARPTRGTGMASCEIPARPRPGGLPGDAGERPG
ncbi:DUF2625 domain-containing protein (plasmid) [Streptomyces atratus]